MYSPEKNLKWLSRLQLENNTERDSTDNPGIMALRTKILKALLNVERGPSGSRYRAKRKKT